MIYGELGLFPIEIDVKLRMISYWARQLTSKETKLSYLSYKILHNLFHNIVEFVTNRSAIAFKHCLFSLSMPFHRPVSIGNLWFVVRNLHSVYISLSSKILK
jgi:hypothetical protein